MKALLTLLFVIFFGAVALAQEVKSTDYDQVETIEIGTLLDTGIVGTLSGQEVEKSQKNRVAYLYMFKNSRVKKALSFRTKRNKAKLA